MRIILAGVGNVIGHDVAVAQAANAVIVTYNVGVEKNALKEMKVSSF
jgi:translation initiation factor IF-2